MVLYRRTVEQHTPQDRPSEKQMCLLVIRAANQAPEAEYQILAGVELVNVAVSSTQRTSDSLSLFSNSWGSMGGQIAVDMF